MTALIINILNNNTPDLDELIRYLVLATEFETQLTYYLNFHRQVWDRLSEIRDSEKIANQDFTGINEEIKSYLKILFIAKARLAQMREIISNREKNIEPTTKKLLEELKFYNRLATLRQNHDYIYHLWSMTIDYTQNTQNYLNASYAELTKKELTVLRVVAMITLILTILGLDIHSSIWAIPIYNLPGISEGIVVLIGLILISILSYWAIRKLIFHGKIRLHRERKDLKL